MDKVHCFIGVSQHKSQERRLTSGSVYIMPCDTRFQNSVKRLNWLPGIDPELVFLGTIVREDFNRSILIKCHRWEDVSLQKKVKILDCLFTANSGEAIKLHKGP